MLRTTLALLIALAASPTSSPLPAAETPAHCALPESARAPGIACIASLAGTWYAVDEEGRPTERAVLDYRVTAGGQAVVETIFPGDEHEMVSLWWERDGELWTTHYCVLGNHPRLRAEREAETGALVLRCRGGENFDSCAELQHMHEARIELRGEDRMRSRWTPWKGGKPQEAVVLEVARAR